jgi:hypothetical protein
MRWTYWRVLTRRTDTDGEVVWARYPDADIKLVTMPSHCTGDGDNKAGLRGEHEGNRKTIAQGMPDDGGGPVVTTLVCFSHLRTRLWVRRAPGIPCALFLLWGTRLEP